VDALAARQALGLATDNKLLAMLPGSRSGEVSRLAPAFLAAARLLWQQNPQLRFVMPAANTAREVELKALLAQQPDLPVTLVCGHSRETMAAADAVLLASGTATLEAALIKRPMVVTYRMAAFSWWLVTRLVKISFAALPNVLAGRSVVPELLQDAAVPEAMAAAIEPLLADEAIANQLQAFDRIHAQLKQGYAAKSANALLQLHEGNRVDG
jgi:lipid-A-disaccharide synthase